tara:strand:- start:10649 stop:11338 length:690 start_codon:yes stop_codon:yes gene_type:complete
MKRIYFLFFLIFTLCAFQNLLGQNTKNASLKEVVDHYFEAIGGREKAVQIKTFYTISKGTFGKKEILLVKKTMLPHYHYSRMSLDGYLISENIFDGKKGRIIQQDIEENFDVAQTRRHRKNRSIFPEFDYLKNAFYKGIENVNGNKAHVLEVENTKIYYDMETGLKVKGVSTKNKLGRSFEQELFFSKYTAVKGLKFPTRLRIVVGGKEMELQVQTLSLNNGVSAGDFH